MCDSYKEQKEMQLCGFRGWRKNLKIAESDYELSLFCPLEEKYIKTKFDNARELLKKEDL